MFLTLLDENTPAETISHIYNLSKSRFNRKETNFDFWKIRCLTIRHENTSAEIIEEIFEDSMKRSKKCRMDDGSTSISYIGFWVTLHPNTPSKVLIQLAEEKPYTVVKHPNTPEHIKQYLRAKLYCRK